jgi:hypothetical protein
MALEKEAARVYAALKARKALEKGSRRFVTSVVLSKKELDAEASPYDDALNEELIALLEYFTANERQLSEV